MTGASNVRMIFCLEFRSDNPQSSRYMHGASCGNFGSVPNSACLGPYQTLPGTSYPSVNDPELIANQRRSYTEPTFICIVVCCQIADFNGETHRTLRGMHAPMEMHNNGNRTSKYTWQPCCGCIVVCVHTTEGESSAIAAKCCHVEISQGMLAIDVH
jgi:hypothetical protein